MTIRNGKSERIVRFVTAHPGCTRAELLAGCGVTDLHWAMPTYCTKVGLIFAAGPRSSRRYYPTAEQASAVHEALCRMVAERLLKKRRENWAKDNLRKIEKRRAAGARQIHSERRIKLDPGVTLAPDFRITVCPTRWV